MQYLANTFILSASDLSNHLGCRHVTQLNKRAAMEGKKPPFRNDPSLDVLKKRGDEHEASYVKYLEHKQKRVINLKGKDTQETIAAMSQGYDVIVQARLKDEHWLGYADILLKREGKSKFGNWLYEVQDTKLALNTRAGTILQLCLYTDLLAAIQDATPEKFYVVKPDGQEFRIDTYNYTDFHAYYRSVKKHLGEIVSGPMLDTYPEDVLHCDICNWWATCDKQRRADDYLSLVAGIRSLHIEELKTQGIRTLEGFAKADTIAPPKRGNIESFVKRKAQAEIQLEGRLAAQLKHRLLNVEAGRGLNRLPQPSLGDIYFDIEGDAFFPDGGLEYLLGYAYYENSNLTYKRTWSYNHIDEKKGFSEFMTFVTERLKKYPDAHIYHFAPYEPSAVKRLSGFHAIFESERDELLRAEKFVDLHAVFKEALLASVERYSLKELEKFTKYTRKIELPVASMGRKAVECALELNEIDALSPDTLKIVEDYNEDDCLATEALHRWLEELRGSLIKEGYAFARPTVKDQEANEKIKASEIRAKSLYKVLTESLPEDRTTWTEAQHAKWLLAHQVDYFRREDKSAWWEFYRVHEMEYEDLFNERKAIVGLEFDSIAQAPKKKNGLPVHRFRFPLQETSIKEDDTLYEVKGDMVGTVKGIDLVNRTIDIKRTARTLNDKLYAVHVNDRIDPGALATALMNIANEIAEEGFDHRMEYQAAKELLMRRSPLLLDGTRGASVQDGEDIVKAAVRLALNLNKSILPIQGPPGTGKTYTGARMIIELIKAKKRVGVTAISHSVIRTLFEKVNELALEENAAVSFVHKISEATENPPAWITEVTDNKKAIEALGRGCVVGGTAWLWANDDSRSQLDYLFIDEAGQMSLSQALAASASTSNVILLGDPQQLEQPQRGAHPEGSDVAALTYLLEGHPTMPEGKGLFLGMTRRIHPSITQFTSEVFYEGRLTSLPGLEKQVISGGTPFDGAGLFFVPVEHRGNQVKSLEEIAAIEKIVEQLLKHGHFTNRENVTKPLTARDILIVAPYNAQVSALSEKLPGLRIGTVDKFQGKEAPVVIYSLTASTIDDAPRGMNFLFSPNRLNVATSRAKSVCILVASPDLLEADCKSIDQMRMANALARYCEFAKSVS